MGCDLKTNLWDIDGVYECDDDAKFLITIGLNIFVLDNLPVNILAKSYDFDLSAPIEKFYHLLNFNLPNITFTAASRTTQGAFHHSDG